MRDSDNLLGKAYQTMDLNDFPTIVIIDKNGHIRLLKKGYDLNIQTVLEEVLGRLIPLKLTSYCYPFFRKEETFDLFRGCLGKFLRSNLKTFDPFVIRQIGTEPFNLLPH